MTNSIIAVHGATGTQGSPVVKALLRAGHRVRAVTRKPDGLPPGVEAAAADLTDAEALVRAYTGVRAVVLQLPLTFDPSALEQAEATLAALAGAGVSRVVFNTGAPLPPTPIGVPFVDARVLLAGKLPAVVPAVAVVAPAATYAENLSAPWSAPLVAAGEVRYPLPEQAPVPWVALDDVAEVIAEQVAAASPAAIQLVAGPQALTGDQVAEQLAAALGRPVRWHTVDADEYQRMLAPHLGETAAAGIAGSYRPGPDAGADRPAPPPLPTVLGRSTLADWARTRPWG